MDEQTQLGWPYFNTTPSWMQQGASATSGFDPITKNPYALPQYPKALSQPINTGYYTRSLNQPQPQLQQMGQDAAKIADSTTDAGKTTGGNIGGYLNAGTAALDIGMSAYHMADEAKTIDTKGAQEQTDAYGRPVWNQGQFAINTGRIKPKGARFGEVAGSTLKGASAGAAFGPWGAVIGGIVGLGASLFGGRRRKRKMREAKRKANKRLDFKRRNYNASVVNYDKQQGAIQQYNDMQDKTSRYYNLYTNNGMNT